MSEKLQTELTAQRQRHHEALEAKNRAMDEIERNDKVIIETTAVIMTLEFAIKQAVPAGPPPGAVTAPPDGDVNIETEPA